ncbi:MAG: transketolase [Parcubacteria group bacterium Gr01-1014_44]|nr:MAG: transketolase [Parcubacteria group bacterium Gr01-1014_44]
MRKEFSKTMEIIAAENKKVIFLTGDLGFMALENVRAAIKDRFINAGVSEQNMISMAAGLASQGLIPICYSIAPFAVFRPAEQIRVDICLHNMNVKIVGNGGGYGYGIMGSTHHALEDLAVLSSFQNMKCYVPFCNEDAEEVVKVMMEWIGPSYLRLGLGPKPTWLKLPKYTHTRKLADGRSVTIVSIGPIILNALKAIEVMPEKDLVDLFVVSEMPLPTITTALQNSLKKTKRLIVLEEHVSRGGLAENLSLLLMKQGISCRLISLCAQGYPNGLYGSQGYHQKINKLDSESIIKTIKKITHGT